MKKLLLVIYITLLITIDQISKYIFYNQKLLSDFHIFTPAFNTGVSRSLPINIYIVIAISIIMIAAIIILYKKKAIGKWATIFLIGGTIGNLIDRIFIGGVRDFIQIFQRFPIFNLADILICTGAILIITKELIFPHLQINKK